MKGQKVILENLPEDILQNGRACPFVLRPRVDHATGEVKIDKRSGRPKYDKVPVRLLPGKVGADKTNPDHFDTVKTAVAAQAKFEYDGIGLSPGFSHIAFGDLDGCLDKDGSPNELAKEYMAALAGAYFEKSPSGRGLRSAFLLDEDFRYNQTRYYTNNQNLGMEFYVPGDKAYFVTVTGRALNHVEHLPNLTMQLKAALERWMVKPSATASATPAVDYQNIASRIAEDERDETALALDLDLVRQRINRSKDAAKFKALFDGETSDFPSQSEAEQSFCNLLAFYGEKDPALIDYAYRQSGLYREKWDELHGPASYGLLTIAKALAIEDVYRSDYRAPQSQGQQDALAFLQSVDLAHNRRYQRDDIGAGYLLADFLKPFARPTPESKGWRYYDGKRWLRDTAAKRVEAAAKDLARAIGLYAAQLEDDEAQVYFKWAGRWSISSNRRTYINEASSVYPVSEGGFDKNPWLLNVNNGTLDLRTGELHDHNPDDLLSRLASVEYDPASSCPRWDRFIREIMAPDEEETIGGDKDAICREKAGFLQRYLGYCLTGDTSAEAFLVCYGPTSRNGKGTCVEAVRAVLGDYAKTVSAETILLSRGRDSRAPSEDIARLVGIRFASIGEPPKGSKLDAARIKSITGGDTINARFLNENSFDYRPQFKLLLHTNHLPECTDMSVFDSDRAMVLKFSRHFDAASRETSLKREFLEPRNQSAILNWLIQGLREYQMFGLKRPAAVVQATREYRRDGDKIARFIDEAIEVDSTADERTSLLYAAYKCWCRENGHYPESSRNFNRALERAGIQITRGHPRRGGEKTTLCVGVKLSENYLMCAG